MKNIFKLLAVVTVFFFASCSDVLDLDGNLENPNEVGTPNLDANLLNNKVQLEFALFAERVNNPAMDLARMTALTGGDVYARAYQPQDFNNAWTSAYQDVLVQLETMLKKTDGTNFTIHSGSARVIKAYVMLTLVDAFGDVPFSEAGNPTIFNPKADAGKDIYAKAIATLDEAIVLLDKSNPAPLTRDIYYGGDVKKWKALANTLKLKAYMNLRLTDNTTAKAKINELLKADLIDTDGEEFTYKFGTADIPARSRHPQYREMYRPQIGSAEQYLNNQFMLSAYKQKGVEDPRWRYYFYRQVGSIAKALKDDPKAIPCRLSPKPGHYDVDQAWCSFDPGFFGRDHGNNDGLPPDTKAKTCWGVYPAGGRSDQNANDADYGVYTQQGQGANGAGILPLWMASFTDFVKAEAAVKLGTDGDAKVLTLDGVKKSITRVRAFGAAKGQALPKALEASDSLYLAKVTSLYDAAPDKLEVIAKEYYLALWGNGIEAYNLYRRTTFPKDIQPMRSATPGAFMRSFLYPSDYSSLNSNAAPAKVPSAVNKVFWDNNPDSAFK
jgi:Starch-binding associating with outer membrane/Susd and RagB outer membrane lipoprotein